MKKNQKSEVWDNYALKKMLRIMRIVIFLVLTTIMQTMAVNTYSQEAKLSLEMREVSVEEVIKEIENQSEFSFIYNKNLINLDRKVEVNFKKADIKDVLNSLFNDKVRYTVMGQQIVLSPKVKDQQQDKNTITVTGVVMDESGESLPGVSVFVKGTTTGITTGMDGDYSLAVSSNDILIFSFVGMKSQEIAVNGRAKIDVTLQTENIGLEEVVAIGYGVQKKSDLTGATVSIKSEQLVETPITRADQAIQGKMAGVSVTTTSGSPAAPIKIRIRGANSINGNNAPLVVIDGFAGGDLSTLSPADIESMEVLKDASATAIYGSRGANGVILVSTKKGKAGTIEFEINSFVGVQSILKEWDLLGAYDYAVLANERSIALGANPSYTDEDIAGFKANGGTDWQDEIMRTSLLNNHQATLSGGTEKSRYLISGNYVDHQGIIKGTDMNRYAIRANIDSKLNNKFTIGFRSYAYRSVESRAGSGWMNGSIVNDALAYEPTLPVYNEDGSYAESPSPILNNPVADYKEPENEYKKNRVELNGFVEYAFNDNLKLKVLGGVHYQHLTNNVFNNQYTYSGRSNNGSASISNSETIIIQNSNILTYNKAFNENHKLNLTLVNEYYKEKKQNSRLGATSFAIESLGFNNVSIGEQVTKPTSGASESSIVSFLGRANYNIKDRYLFTASLRADGASKFADGNQWGYFPSGSVAWRASEEEFMASADQVSNLKLRASFGVTGSQATGPYQSLAAFDSGADYAFDGTNLSTGIQLSRQANPELKWEKTEQVNLGIDLGLWDSRLNMSMDYYKKNTKDLLLDIPLPLQSGFKTELRNIGEVQNEGFEFLVSAVPVNGAFNWETNFNFAVNKTETVDLGGAEQIFTPGMHFIMEPGQPTGQFYGYIYDGVYTTAMAAEAAKYGKKPGDAIIRDLDGNLKINSDDKTVIGNANHDLIFGFNNSFSYKNFDLNVFVNGMLGGEVYNQSSGKPLGFRNNPPKDARYLDRWSTDNEDGRYPAFSKTNDNKIIQASSILVEDASFLRLKNLSLGYTFPKQLVQRWNLSKLRLYVSGQNLFVVTDYSGYDPEVSHNGESDVQAGLDVDPYPSARIVTFGVDIKF
ncbi:SusC/RagA family TonB-linked outer membrane protein [Puteibacter caeruleilacunae]|nr:SusC/RagA family TonB-linked outer membrane protein [Puteibacter caeruleilacunae]